MMLTTVFIYVHSTTAMYSVTLLILIASSNNLGFFISSKTFQWLILAGG